MRKLLMALAAAGLLAGVLPARAQDEIVVTGLRKIHRDDNGDERIREMPVLVPAAVQMMRRTADFAIQQVTIASDTVDEDVAKAEVLAMTRKAIDLAGASGVLVATGEIVVEPLTVSTYKELEILDEDGNVDGEFVKFLVKVPLVPGIDAKTALARIDKFIKAVPAVGRAQMAAYSELTLSVVDPEQYRGAIIDLIAKDTNTTSSKFGSGYGVEVTGLDKPVQWKRASLTEVQLFLPSNSTVRPRN